MSSSTLQSSAFICRSCSRHLRPAPSTTCRAFSTTPSASMPSTASPYSPYYVDIPFPPQRYAPWKPRAKGKRPVPRNIFPKARGARKVSPEYLALVSKEPSKFSKPGENAPATEKAYITWKERMAESRRRNIRDGLLQLHADKSQRDSIIAKRSEKKQALRAELLAQEDPDVVKLTTPSILSALRTRQPLTDPDREERLAAKREKYERIEEEKFLRRQESLHELYIRANDFIFAEAQLDEIINAKFSDIAIAEAYHSIPPDSQKILSEESNKLRGPDEWVMRDVPILKAFAEALTGGSRRTKTSESIDGFRDVMDEIDVAGLMSRPKMEYANFGYGSTKKEGDESAKKKQSTADLFSILANRRDT
ncbi:hypothetical protein H072_7482 [Dactylellina haptotyla CBS 200.50]|uniref:Uncharacterized protein n=1 Tax=Dactylellina haptotyla (strain CBS 200.50) TaxID=1284197 RepID=S8ACG1_DACHA|nr:hypothetical protein H072_7482 [Dactylellina haptotyla CBS 200.50]